MAEIAQKGGWASKEFWLERPRCGGVGLRKVKRRKKIGAEENYFWGGMKWTSLVQFGGAFSATLFGFDPKGRAGLREKMCGEPMGSLASTGSGESSLLVAAAADRMAVLGAR